MTEAQIERPEIGKPILDSDQRKVREDIAKDIAVKLDAEKRGIS